MADAPAPSLDEHLWTIAIARLMFAPSMNIQAPPNLSPGALRRLIEAGINDWGGVSPVTPDHVNPEAPWPHLEVLERATKCGRQATGRAPGDLSGLCPRRRTRGSIRRCGRRCCIASTPTAGRAPTIGRPGTRAALPPMLARAGRQAGARRARSPRSWRTPGRRSARRNRHRPAVSRARR